MPKLVIDGTMDEFFLLDDSSYWWNQMPNAYELNRFLMVPNAEHTQVTGIFLKKRINNTNIFKSTYAHKYINIKQITTAFYYIKL
mgnify:CR=1 FL=1